MKFLVDAQLPKSLCDVLRAKAFDSIHTPDLPDKNRTTDNHIIKISNNEDRVVITKDEDFRESFLLKREPRKLIIVTTGNIHNTELKMIFEKSIDQFVSLLSENALIEVNKNEFVGLG